MKLVVHSESEIPCRSFLLTEKERNFLKSCSPQRQREWMNGRIALKKAYQLFHPKRLSQSTHIMNDNRGVPQIVGSQVFCSIAHSHGLAVGAVSNHPTGIDIEWIRPHTPHLLQYIGTGNEIALLAEDKKEELMTLLWTIKESVLKGIGSGFQISPKNLRIHQKLKNRYTVTPIGGDVIPQDWWVYSYRLDNHYIAIATSNTHEQPELYWYNGTQLHLSGEETDTQRIREESPITFTSIPSY
jgi:phosphopantetheinyl transferase